MTVKRTPTDHLLADPLPPDRRVTPRQLVSYGLWLGLGMIAAAWIWRGAPGDHLPPHWFPAAHWALDVALGALVGLGFGLGAWRLLDWVPSLKRIEELVVTTVDMSMLRYRHAVYVGLLAGIPEEILFRGAIQPTLGLVLTSALFGALHAITWVYFVYAMIAGMVLGVLAQWRSGLWASVAAHTVIDVVMLALLIRSWRRRGLEHPPSGTEAG
ncbi:MAG: CPBP family intramembrane metalloprotease [Anaerolineae bacterium]|nr:CPBP family intramembrane metalloprotease [Anaerolineae bacterium]